MSEEVRQILDAHTELAWDDFVVEMPRQYPANHWPSEGLHAKLDELLAHAEQAIRAENYLPAGEMRAQARSIGVVLFEGRTSEVS
jgi:hypothetical protein